MTTTTSTAPAPVTGPRGIPELATEIIGDEQQEWRGLRAVGDRLFAYHSLPGGQRRQVRFDPDTGSVVTAVEYPAPDTYAFTPAGLVEVRADLHTIDIRDLDSLEVLRTIDLGADARTQLTTDAPRAADPFWIGLRRYDADQLSGVYTRMAAVRLDLTAGTVLDERPAPPCGASTVAAPDPDQIVMGVDCAYQVVGVELTSGAEQTYESFPSGVAVFAVDSTVWLRWKPFGYIGRLEAGAEAIETLDLNVDGPTLQNLYGFVEGPRGVWVLGILANDPDQGLLYLIDPESFEVSARTWTDVIDVAFIGDRGFTMSDGMLATFDPASVVGGAPADVVRPEPGALESVEPTDDDQRGALAAFSTVFDPTVPNEVALPLVEGGEAVADVRNRLVDLVEQLYPGVELKVTAVAVDGDTASVAYSYLLDGKVAFVPLSGTLRREGEAWIVTRESVCQLAEQAAIPGC